MAEETQPVEVDAEFRNSVLKEFTCRLCLYQNKTNTEIVLPTSSGLCDQISKYLSMQVLDERNFPIWICKYCQQSLISFHEFHSKVSQIQTSLNRLLSSARQKNASSEEPQNLDMEINVIETVVGFGRSKRNRSLPQSCENKAVRRNPKRGTLKVKINCNRSGVPPDLKGNPSASLYEENCKNSKENDPNIKIFDIKTEEDEQAASSVVDDNSAVVPDGRSFPDHEDDRSSLEDQDWVGQGFDFSMDSEINETCHLPSTSKVKSKRKSKASEKVTHDSKASSDNDGEVPDKVSPQFASKKEINETCHLPGPAKVKSKRKSKASKKVTDDAKASSDNDIEVSDEDSPQCASKKAKLRISATHGTEPKPSLPFSVRKMLRQEINAKFVEFYGITCDICMKDSHGNSPSFQPVKYSSFDDLCAHMQTAHDERGYVKCCNCTMRERKRAERHMLLHTQPGSIYKCNICGKQLSSQQSFRSHILLHLPDSERPFKCSHCDRGFVSKADLTHHERVHLPEDKRLCFTCDTCGSRFTSEQGLMTHKQRVHENIRPHLCDLCAKSFSSRCDMERHRVQIHESVKREQCPVCGKWFKGPSILKTHMRQHGGAEYKCQYCDKVYSVRSSWKAHLIKHSDEKPHKCPICEKAFKLPGTLRMHLNQHTGELPYSCPFCPRKFASSGNYYTHRKRMHKNEVAQIKEETEAALASSGLPPPSTVSPPSFTQSLSEAIAQTKEIVAAKSKETSVASESQASVSPTLCPPPVLAIPQIPLSLNVIANTNIGTTTNDKPKGSGVLLAPSFHNKSLVIPQFGKVISTVPIGISTVPNSSSTVQVIPKSFQATVPGHLKLVRVVTPDGSSKLVFVKEQQVDSSNVPVVRKEVTAPNNQLTEVKVKE